MLVSRTELVAIFITAATISRSNLLIRILIVDESVTTKLAAHSLASVPNNL